MANIAIFRINYKSDFILTLNSDAGWLTPFCIKFWTGAPSQAYFVGFDGTTYTHCAPVAGEPTKLLVQFDDHHLPIGDLKFQIGYHFTVADFPTSVEDEVINQASVIIEVDGAPAKVMLDLNGETAPEIEFSLPAYANEAQRIENEQQRIENEQQRIDNEQQRIDNEQTRQRNEGTRIENEQERVREFGQMKGDLEQATRDATAAAENANEKGVYAKNQGDYAKQQGDYAKQQGDTAKADHERAEEDHRIAGEDHTQAGSDHTRAGEDHTQAGSDHTRAGEDHTRAGEDHTRAGEDHTRAESDHAAVEVYVDSLGAFDISAYHATGGVLAKYADLTAALGTNGANIPEALRKGGMSVKFVQSSDNKYVQYRLTKNTWSTIESDWQCYFESEYDSKGDLNFADENDNIILSLRGGHVVTKNFDSRKTNITEDNVQSSVDLSIQDEQNNMLFCLSEGHLMTKHFDSRNLQIAKSHLLTDLEFSDTNGRSVLVLLSGDIITKNFNSRNVLNKISELEDEVHQNLLEWSEEWSRMPKMEQNPLAKVRFDGGMTRIFRKWGFIGDSLNSGETYGFRVSVFNFETTSGKAISDGQIVDDQTSVISENKTISAYNPQLKLTFESNTGLNGKVLLASVSNGVLTPIITGSTALSYTAAITSGTTVVISYPSSNVPEVLLSIMTVSDIYDLSWGMQLVRLINAEGFCYSVGGEYAKRWCIGDDNSRRWQAAQTSLKDAYTIALGQNDRNYWMRGNTEVVDYPCVTAYPNQSQYGSLTLTEQQVLADIDDSNYENNLNSYAGWYYGIIQRLKSVRKDAQIFCITNPGKESEWNQVIRILVNHARQIYGNSVWLVDLATYNPVTLEMSENCNLNGHLSAFGYLYSAYQISTYIDWLIRNNIDDFRGTSLIGTGSTVKQFDKIFINN